MHRKKYVLKNKKRFNLFLIVLTFVILTPLFATTAYGFKEVSYIDIKVKEGDTLWNIASEYSKGGDIREYIYEIKKLNKMQNSNIYPGESILLPSKN